MKPLHSSRLLFIAGVLFLNADMQATPLDDIGVSALRAVTTNLNGAGIRVAQPEAGSDLGTNWEVNPAAVGQPVGLFSYASSLGSSTNFPNFLSPESGHANGVAQKFYGTFGGVATNVAHVDSYDADFYITNYVFNLTAAPPATIVNQSFTFGTLTNNDQQDVDSAYDNYAETFGTFFISAACNASISPTVAAPGTAYNCISVAAYGGGSSIGPTIDNGRCKPDITTPAGDTSTATPQVAGAAAVLMQAALRGDGGSDTNSAFDLRTIKALLLNGTIKPPGWTNGVRTPLDARHGAGILNVFNSYQQLGGGKHSASFSTNVPFNTAHPPLPITNSINALSGWDFNTNTSSLIVDNVQHYYFNVANQIASVKFTATATLVWNRHYNATYQISPIGINDLNLFLYDCSNSNLVACSTSLVDNVEHLYLTNFAQGRYDLQVWKAGGAGIVSIAEPYALAWEFVPPPVLAISGGANPTLNWPLYPAGFLVEARTNLPGGTWSVNGLPAPFITNGLNSIPLNMTNGAQFFRLRKPNL